MAINFDFRSRAIKSGHLDYPLQIGKYAQICSDVLHLNIKIFHSHKLTFIQLQIASESGVAEHGLVGSGVVE